MIRGINTSDKEPIITRNYNRIQFFLTVALKFHLLSAVFCCLVLWH